MSMKGAGMELRVTARGRGGEVSDRSAKHESVHDITSPGPCWAVDAKVERSSRTHLRSGAIVRYWNTRAGADADAALIKRGMLRYKDTDRLYFDPVVTDAVAYWR
jgi:hypothetical protein